MRGIRRREFITVLGGGAVASSLAAQAQQTAKPVVGFLNGGSPVRYAPLTAFHEGLKQTGYIEAQNVAIDYRWAEGRFERLPAFAADLIQRNVNVIVATSTPAALAAKAATTTIPIVFTSSGDPRQLGLVAALIRPGGNVTGVTQLNVEAAPKRLELAHELAPTAAMIAVLVNPTDPNTETLSNELAVAARARGFDVASPEGYLARLPGVQGESAGALRSCRSACEHQSRPHPHFGNGGATAGDLQRQGVCRSGGPDILWAELS